MNRRILMGLKRLMIPVPRQVWQREVARGGAGAARSLQFMTDDHHRVRNFVVDEIAHTGKAIAPEKITEKLGMPLNRLASILDELEKRLTFLYRAGGDTVHWAYPVTAEQTPHRVRFTDGRQVYAA